MPFYAIMITRQTTFGMECDNILQAQAKCREALRDMGMDAQWTEEIEATEILPEDFVEIYDED